MKRLYCSTGGTATVPGGCGDPHERVTLYVLAADGPQAIGAFDYCDTVCPDRWLCSSCPEVTEADGAVVFRHVGRKHRRLVTGP